jgi:hypothetical protein
VVRAALVQVVIPGARRRLVLGDDRAPDLVAVARSVGEEMAERDGPLGLAQKVNDAPSPAASRSRGDALSRAPQLLPYATGSPARDGMGKVIGT